MNSISSGIRGLDDIMEGGFQDNSIIMLSGPPGSGKTIFGMQFLVNSKEPGIFVSFEQEPDSLHENFSDFDMNLEKLESSNKLRILKYDPFRLEDILEVIENNIREIGAKRIVFDTISSLGVYMKDPAEFRKTLLELNRIMKKNECTTLLLSEIVPGSSGLSRFGVEEFVADAVIVLFNGLSEGEYRRTITVWKMRGSNHSKKVHPYMINENGFFVNSKSVVR